MTPETGQALALLGAGMARGDFGGGLLAASQYAGGMKEQKLKEQFMQMQMLEAQAQAQERQQKAAALEAERRRQEAIRNGIPNVLGLGGQPQAMGQPGPAMGGAPMQPAGGLNLQEAIRLGMTPQEIQAYAGLTNLGRQEVARTVNVPGPNGEKMVQQLDKFGQPVGQPMTEFEAAQFLNLGNRQVAVVPRAGQQFQMGMSPEAQASNSLGWANHNLSRQRLALDATNAQAGKAPPGYRFKQDGSLEAIPGGPADIKAGEQGEKTKQRQQSAITQADSVLKEIKDAKGLVGWNTAGVGGMMSVVPQTDARDLAAKLQTVKANLGFDRLQQMREQSPTGGALGQVAVQELAALQATVASLDQMQSPSQLGQALDKIEKHYTNWRNTVNQAANAQGGASGGWSIQEKR